MTIIKFYCSSPSIGEKRRAQKFCLRVSLFSPDQDVTDEEGWPLAWDAADAFFSPGKVEVLTKKAGIPTQGYM